MKIVVVCLVMLAGLVSVAAAHQAGIGPFANTLPVSLPAPHGLIQTTGVPGHKLPAGQWTHRATLHFRVKRQPGRPNLRLQVELTKNGATASNSPSATEPAGRASPKVTVRGLSDGSYHWWARFYDGSAISPWVPFSSGPAFKIDATPPTTPSITSTTNPVQGKLYRSGTVAFSWSATDDGSGISVYRYAFGPKGQAKRVITRANSLTLTDQPTGAYVLKVWAKDHAGNWSRAGRYHVTLDSTAPTICSCSGFSAFSFNPHYNGMTFNYLVSEPATIRIGIYNPSNDRVRLVIRHSTKKNQLLHYTWHGRDNHSHIVAPGDYSFVVRVTDVYGNSNVYTYSNLQVLDKVIIVSVSQQKMWAYQAGHVVISTLVTTGNVNCCGTPPGLYTILASYHPFTFRSPFQPGNFYYYPPSPVNYAMLFDTRGYYIHDAPWRTDFGPGTDLVAGQPGTADTGTHGCVNTPLDVAKFLYYWAPIGTPVKVLG